MASDDRREFLMHVYDQLMNDINRHLLIVWQAVSVVVGAVALLALAEKQVLAPDIATSLVLGLDWWFIAHNQDASYWYNRNLVIIANIEREFLVWEDQGLIHAYFGQHRKGNRMISHLGLQQTFGIALAAIVVLAHFLERILPGLTARGSAFDPLRCLPYLVAIVGTIHIRVKNAELREKYEEFLHLSPGKTIDTSGFEFTVGHSRR